MAKISIVPWIVKKLKRCIGIVEDTDTASQAIASNKYVIWKGDICKSTSAISEGDTLSSSNLLAVNDGVGNDLLQDIANINTSLGTYGAIQVTAGSKFTLVTSRVQLFGPFAYCAITVKATQAFGNSDVLAVVPSGYRPNRYTLDLMTIVRRNDAINAIFNGMCNINTNGEIKEAYSASAGQANDILTVLFIYNT